MRTQPMAQSLQTFLNRVALMTPVIPSCGPELRPLRDATRVSAFSGCSRAKHIGGALNASESNRYAYCTRNRPRMISLQKTGGVPPQIHAKKASERALAKAKCECQ